MNRSLPALLLLAVAATTLAEEPAPPANAPKAKPAAESMAVAKVAAKVAASVKKRSTYTPAEFEMDVGPPVKRGDVIVETLSYRSPYESVDPVRNDVVKARLFRTEKPEAAAVIALGGWRFDPFTPEMAKEIAQTGIQALYIEIPFQGGRTPKKRRPGELTLSSDLEQTEATFVQLAQDVARAVEWLVKERQVDAKRIGIVGTSLGGFAATTLYGMQDRFACCVSLLSGADVAQVIYNGNYLTDHVRAGLEAKEITEKQTRARLRGVDPLTWADPKKKSGLLMIAAEKDVIVPLENVRKLAKAYDGARVEVAKGASHVAILALRAHVPMVKEHFEARLLGREPGTGDRGTE